MLGDLLLSDDHYLRQLGLPAKAGLTLVAVLVVTGIRLVIDPFVTGLRFLLYFPTVALVAFAFDSGMGYLAAVVSTAISAWLFVPPRFGWPQTPTLWVMCGFALAFMLFETWVVQSLSRTVRVLRRAENEKTALLAELNHRTKNNLQMLCSILTVQALSIPDEAVRRLFEDTIARIGVIGRIHGTLYSTGEYETVDVQVFLRDLCEALQLSLVGGRAVFIRVEAEPWSVELDRAIPLGLVVNELVTNALKHAFPAGREGRIVVRVTRRDGEVRLMVEDNGVGLAGAQTGEDSAPGPAAEPGAAGGVGSKLVHILSSQLGGTLKTTSEGGTRAELVFPAAAS